MKNSHNVMARRTVIALSMTAALSGCNLFREVEQPKPGKVTRLEVHKSSRRLDAFSGDRRLRSYDVSLGFAPLGHKLQQGDGKTPVGRYEIDRKNPQSLFYLSLGLSYPNRTDVRLASARGVNPGGDIFIHGQPNGQKARKRRGDWTEGCIALTNAEMATLYHAVEVGTPVYIYH